MSEDDITAGCDMNVQEDGRRRPSSAKEDKEQKDKDAGRRRRRDAGGEGRPREERG